ncbi:dhhc zinc finger domain-containing protein [Stylonychia lemnae]|uniref:Dhhc zinc finger domain-containing protein n=1 Tax=Stylonychia lemnae TaxID=5949 RepID=A0A078BBC2_STYLE|nr:dhhc zinc finger domain-containing protein [Stylonychia lemnae]|eukprot:CDW91855.1 dhhc zinc finger domain-containing protein [Stylonychia lemnae]
MALLQERHDEGRRQNNNRQLDDFENDPALDDETKAKLRREKAAIERKRIRELIRLRRDVEAEKTSAGVWARQAEEEFKKRILLPNSLLKTVKTIIIVSLMTFIYIAWLCGHKTTACQNTLLKNITLEDRFLYLLYWITTFLHLLSIVIMFSNFGRGTVVLSVLMGILSFVWHISNLILYFTSNDNNANLPFMYWAEMILNFILILASIQILIKVDFVPLTPEEIEKIELQELKHRMEIKQQQRMEKQKKAQEHLEVNEFGKNNGPRDGNYNQINKEFQNNLNKQKNFLFTQTPRTQDMCKTYDFCGIFLAIFVRINLPIACASIRDGNILRLNVQLFMLDELTFTLESRMGRPRSDQKRNGKIQIKLVNNLKEPPGEMDPARVKLCKKCDNSWKPERAHHCSECGNCIFKVNHHQVNLSIRWTTIAHG